MSEYERILMRGFYRATSHLPVWEIIQEAGIWDQVGIDLVSFEYCDSSSRSEEALFGGEIDFISGNHITPYTLFKRGRPIVHIASPSNAVKDVLVTKEPIKSLTDLRGMRLGTTAQSALDGGYAHNRGNHMLYLLRAGVQINEVTWVELAEKMSDAFRHDQLQAMLDGRADAAFVTGNTDRFNKHGFHTMQIEPLPMINGPTITSTTPRLRKNDRLGERLVKAMALGTHYANVHPEESARILKNLEARLTDESGSYHVDKVARLPRKPYPEIAAVENAYRLAVMQYPETAEVSPLAIWDVHYLRELDDTGFIDGLYTTTPAAARP